MLGLPPSPSKASIAGQSDSAKQIEPQGVAVEKDYSQDTGLDALITRLCAPVDGRNPEDWIMNERMAEKEVLMMDGE